MTATVEEHAAPTAAAEKVVVTLPFSKRAITITARRLTGQDMVTARRLTKPNDAAADLVFTYALWASVLENSRGQRLVLEDILLMDAVDIAHLSEELGKDSRFQQSGEAAKTSTSPSPA